MAALHMRSACLSRFLFFLAFVLSGALLSLLAIEKAEQVQEGFSLRVGVTSLAQREARAAVS